MIGLIGAMEEEIILLRSVMANARVENDPKSGAFEFYHGQISGADVVLLRSGIGKVQAAVGCALLIEKYSPRLVINTGCAGGINPAGTRPLNFGDAVISDGLVYHDFDISAFGYALGQVPGRNTAVFPVEAPLIESAEKTAQELKEEGVLPAGFNAIPGLICSGDVFMTDSKRVLELTNSFPNLRAVEMEGAAIAHCAALFNTPALVLRCISDIAGEESPIKFDEFLPIAAKNSSEIVKRLVKKLKNY